MNAPDKIPFADQFALSREPFPASRKVHVPGSTESIRVPMREIALSNVRLVYFGSEVKPTLGTGAMAAAEGRPWNEATAAAVSAALSGDLDPMDNTLGKPATKLHWQRVLTRRALDEIAA